MKNFVREPKNSVPELLSSNLDDIYPLHTKMWTSAFLSFQYKPQLTIFQVIEKTSQSARVFLREASSKMYTPPETWWLLEMPHFLGISKIWGKFYTVQENPS